MSEETEFKAAYIIPIVQDSDDRVRVLFLERKNSVVDQEGKELYPEGVLDLPGGGTENNHIYVEPPLESALREFREEVGFRPEKEMIRPIGVFESIDGKLVAYFVYDLDSNDIRSIKLLESEHTGWALLSDLEIETRLKNNEVLDVHADMALLYLRGEEIQNGREIHLKGKRQPWWLNEPGRETRSSMFTKYARN